MENKYLIKDNFLNKEYYQQIKDFLNHPYDIPWYWSPQDTKQSKNKNGYFTFSFYNNHRPDHPAFNLIIDLLKELNCKAPIEIRANLSFRDVDSIESSYHVDLDSRFNYKNSKTAILFFTTCNAKTILKVDDKEVVCSSVENRVLIFDSTIQHKVRYQTDVHKRHIINLNYF